MEIAANDVVQKVQKKVHDLTATAAAVATPVVLAGSTVVAGSALGAMVGKEVAGEAAASTFGEFARGSGEAVGKLAGTLGGTALTNSVMTLASSCQLCEHVLAD